jgi:hypothetical protein
MNKLLLALALFLAGCQSQPIVIYIDAETRDADKQLIERTTYRALIIPGYQPGVGFGEPAVRPVREMVY